MKGVVVWCGGIGGDEGCNREGYSGRRHKELHFFILINQF